MEQERLQIIDIVNKIFGETGWSFSVSNVAVDYIDDSRNGNYSAGASAVVRVQRSNGVFREDIGFGSNCGPNKADVISKAKKDAVTDGLRGAVINFGSDIAQQMTSSTPRKLPNENPRIASMQRGSSFIAQTSAQPNNHVPSPPPPQATIKPNSVSRSLGEKTPTQALASATVAPQISTTSHPTSGAIAAPPKQTPLPQPTSPLAVPLPRQPQASTAPQKALSDEELAKMERIRRSKEKQEEFRKKHLLEQAQAQSKAQDKGVAKPSQQSSREPLREQQTRNQRSSTSKGNGTNGLLDADDEVMLSTQDMEAISAIAANNVSRHSPILSSPSTITRNSGSDAAKSQSNRPIGNKRPDLTSYAFNPEKRQRSESRC